MFGVRQFCLYIIIGGLINFTLRPSKNNAILYCCFDKISTTRETSQITTKKPTSGLNAMESLFITKQFVNVVIII